MIVIGLMSGTSVDGIDAALVDIQGTEQDLAVNLLTGATFAYPEALRAKILAVCGGQALTIKELAELDDAIAIQFAEAAQKIQAQQQTATLIGSHGQTIYHRSPQATQTSTGHRHVPRLAMWNPQLRRFGTPSQEKAIFQGAN